LRRRVRGSRSACRPTLRYHVAVHRLAERLRDQVRRYELLRAGDRVGVAVSGGIDSVALLRLLLELRQELGIVLSVVHFNHKLRGAESDADQGFVADLAGAHGLEFHADGDDVARHVAEERVSVEAAARELRYGFFRQLLGADGSGPQGLKPDSGQRPSGTTEVVPFPNPGVARSGVLQKIVTGHTLDDQAETVLMRVIRGSGVNGLGAIYPRILVEDDGEEVCGEIVRPMLSLRRCELQQYLLDMGQGWREDSSNADEHFTRNRLRKLVMPLLEKEFNPAVAESLSELAEIARGEEDYWENEVAGWLGTTVQWAEPDWARALSKTETTGLVQISSASTGESQNPHFWQNRPEVGHPLSDDLSSRIEAAPWLVANASVSRIWFLGESVAVQRRLVKAIGERAGIPLAFKHVEEILNFVADASKTSGKELALPLGWKLMREPDEILFLTPDLREKKLSTTDYEYELPVPGRISVQEAGFALEAKLTSMVATEAGYNPEHLLDAESLPGPLRVRNWRPGDRYWPAHTKSPKKIKELLQERHIAQPERKLWPVVVSGDEIVWLRGFRTAANFQARPGRRALVIEVIPFDNRAT
jgi:tRNA(Ile)-lysidine synthase